MPVAIAKGKTCEQANRRKHTPHMSAAESVHSLYGASHHSLEKSRMTCAADERQETERFGERNVP